MRAKSSDEPASCKICSVPAVTGKTCRLNGRSEVRNFAALVGYANRDLVSFRYSVFDSNLPTDFAFPDHKRTLSMPMALRIYNFKWIAPTRYDCWKP